MKEYTSSIGDIRDAKRRSEAERAREADIRRYRALLESYGVGSANELDEARWAEFARELRGE